MKRLENMDEENLMRIAHAFAESFLAGPGSLSSCMNIDQAEIYFALTLYEYMRVGALYAYGDDEEAYIVYHRKRKGIPWYRDLLLTYRYFTQIQYETMQRMVLMRRDWIDYTVTHSHDRDYVDVALIAVRREYQGQGYLRKVLAEPFAIADQYGIPVVLDTDAEWKALRYEGVGMRAEKDQILPSGLHMYTMIYNGKEKP